MVSLALALEGGDEVPEVDEALLVHGQAELLWEVAQGPGHGAAYLLQLLVVHQEPAGVAAYRAQFPTEIAMLLTLSQHSAEK
jgi:hypothetical protein